VILETQDANLIMDIRSSSTRLLFAALSVFLAILSFVHYSEAQVKKVRVAIPGYTIAVLSFVAAKMNGYYTAEGLDVELIAMRLRLMWRFLAVASNSPECPCRA
jgi:cell division protein FtsW (lipid II flippase)